MKSVVNGLIQVGKTTIDNPAVEKMLGAGVLLAVSGLAYRLFNGSRFKFGFKGANIDIESPDSKANKS